MSRKTIAELVAEIQSLKQENERLRDENSGLLEGIDKLANLYTPFIANGARANQKLLKGSQVHKRKADERQLFLAMRFNNYRNGGMHPQRARNKANEDVRTVFGKGYEKSNLYRLLPAKPRKNSPVVLFRERPK